MKKVDIDIKEKSYEMREELNTLRTNLQFCGEDKKVILMTSSLSGEGKTTTSIGLATSLAEIGKTVILVDADIRKSVMASRLHVKGQTEGVSHYLSGQCNLTDAIVATNIPRFFLLFSGLLAPNPTELLESVRFQKMIESLRKAYDYVIVDCPPLGLVIDAAIIARSCDGAIIVVESAKTKYRIVQDVKRKLDTAGIPILGVVLNKVEHKKNKGYYSKYYGKDGYNKYYSAEDVSKKKNVKMKRKR